MQQWKISLQYSKIYKCKIQLKIWRFAQKSKKQQFWPRIEKFIYKSRFILKMFKSYVIKLFLMWWAQKLDAF